MVSKTALCLVFLSFATISMARVVTYLNEMDMGCEWDFQCVGQLICDRAVTYTCKCPLGTTYYNTHPLRCLHATQPPTLHSTTTTEETISSSGTVFGASMLAVLISFLF